MRAKLLIIPAVLLVLVLASAGAVMAYDGGRPTQIAKGMRVAGIDIGGLTPQAARARIAAEVDAGLARPVLVHHDKATWTLSAREARVTTNVGRLVDDAVARSDEGGIIRRTLRRLAGGRIEADLQPEVTFSDRAVIRLVDRVRKDVRRAAKDAQMQITPAGVTSVESRRGLEVRASELHAAIDRAIVSPTGARRFVARTRKVEPKVTTEQLVARNPVVLIADRGGHTLKVYKRLRLARSYGIAVGSAGHETPAGQYTIANKAVDPVWTVPNSAWAGDLAGKVIPGGTPENPLKARWLGITDGVGIHGTSDEGSVGSNASHGCLRMRVADVIDLYPQVPVGSKILIV